MNFADPAFHVKIEALLEADCVRVPAPQHKPVYGDCLIPKSRITVDGDIINQYSSRRIQGVSIPRHCLALALKLSRLPAKDKKVSHGCDRKACCNKHHVREGTAKEDYEEAVARGRYNPRGRKGIPRPSIQGGKNCRAKATDEQMTGIKWLIENAPAWFVATLMAGGNLLEALGYWYGLTVPSLKLVLSLDNWRHIVPSKPDKLPTPEDIPYDAKAPLPKKDGPIGPDNASLILQGYWASEDKPQYIKDWAQKLKVSVIAVQNVISGKTWPEREPHILRETNFAHHRPRAKLSPREVQAIRATYALYKHHFGIKAALGRKFNVQSGYITQIVLGIAQMDVADDPSAALALSDLDFRPPTRRGETHKLAKLNDDQVRIIRKRIADGESLSKLAAEFGVSYQIIKNIKSGKRRPSDERSEGGKD